MNRNVVAVMAVIGLFYPVVARGEGDESIEAALARQSKVATYHRTYKAAPKEIALGRRLFFDPRLSLSGKMSCATCHRPERQFGDGLPRAMGRLGKPVTRNTPSLLTATFHRYLFWDGRAETIEEAALTAVQNPEEMAQPLPALREKLAALPEYAREFAAVYPGAGISSTTIGRAWGAYVISLAAPEDSPFDRYLADRTGLSSAALSGYRIFAYKAECIYCHSSRHFNYNSDRYLSIGLKPAPFDDPGRYRIEPSPELWGAFRVPSLRDVALTAPYMHDGRFATLEDVIDYYDRGGDGTRSQDSIIRPLHLTVREKADLKSFLLALTSSRVAEEDRAP